MCVCKFTLSRELHNLRSKTEYVFSIIQKLSFSLSMHVFISNLMLLQPSCDVWNTKRHDRKVRENSVASYEAVQQRIVSFNDRNEIKFSMLQVSTVGARIKMKYCFNVHICLPSCYTEKKKCTQVSADRHHINFCMANWWVVKIQTRKLQLNTLNGMGWTTVCQSKPVDRWEIRTSSSDWHSRDKRIKGRWHWCCGQACWLYRHIAWNESQLSHHILFNDLFSLYVPQFPLYVRITMIKTTS